MIVAMGWVAIAEMYNVEVGNLAIKSTFNHAQAYLLLSAKEIKTKYTWTSNCGVINLLKSKPENT